MKNSLIGRSAGGVAMWVAALLLVVTAVGADGGDAVLGEVAGVVERGSGEPPVWRTAATGDALAPGDRVRTGRDGRAELSWRGATIRLYGDSLLRLPGTGAGVRGVGLEGAGLFDVQHREGDAFEVRTPDVVVSVKGTRFGVSADGAQPEVWVYRGTVGVRGASDGAREVLVREGFRSLGGADDPAELFLLDHPDPWDDWAVQKLPRTAMAPPAALADRALVVRRARDRALTLAIQRNPELADRLVAVRAELKQALAQGGGGDGGRLLAADPLLDASTADAELLLRSQFIEQVLDAPVQVALSRDGVIQIVDQSLGQVWQLDQNDLVDILEGTSNLPATLDTVLGVTQPEEQTELVTTLLGLLGH